MTKILEYDCSSGQLKERNMTDEELSVRASDELIAQERALAIQQEEEARESARQKLIELGLSEEEIAALIK